MTRVRDEITGTIRRTLASEAQRNEYRVAIVRSYAWGLVAIVDAVLVAVGRRTTLDLAMSGAIFALTIATLVLVRARYRAWLRFAIPVFDAAVVAWLLNHRIEARGLEPVLVETSALAASIFAMTGGLRFDKKANVWTSVLAIAVLWITLGRRTEITTMIYGVAALSATALLSIWVTGIVERSMEATSSRIVMSRFVPAPLLDLDDPLGALGAPRELHATVLMSDLRGFTSLAEKMKPAEVLAFLNEVQSELAEAVELHGGVIDKFMGDGMLAVFGASSPPERHAARALDAAAEIRRRVAAINARRSLPVKIGIGIHTGALVAGCIGSGARLEFTVIGDAVNIASRVEALTKELGQDVLATEDTAREAERDLPRVGRVAIRGRSAETTLHSLP